MTVPYYLGLLFVFGVGLLYGWLFTAKRWSDRLSEERLTYARHLERLSNQSAAWAEKRLSNQSAAWAEICKFALKERDEARNASLPHS